MNNFAVVIPTHGRSDRVYTVSTLRKHGYTGDIYLVCDDGDKELELYKEKYGDKVLVFNKDEIAGTFDKMDNFGNKNVVVFARNALYKLAKDAGLKYIAVLDDDYTDFSYRVTENYSYIPSRKIKRLDDVFAAFVQYLKVSGVGTVCFMQGGDFVGGALNKRFAIDKITLRKMMNLFFFDVDKPIEFKGTINEDLTSSLAENMVGNVIHSTPLVTLQQKATQSNSGGLTDIYLELGTYVKSFYSVMYAPSVCKVALMGNKDMRLHHKITWKYSAPKILREGT